MIVMAPDSVRTSSTSSYPALGLVVGVFAAVVLAYWGSIASMTEIWTADGYRHSFLIPLIAGYLLWHDRPALAASRIAPSWAGFVLLVLAVWLWFIGRQALLQALEHLALLGILHAAVAAVGGWQVYRRSAFALCYLVLAIPLGFESIPWLMQLTASMSGFGLGLLGIPVLREGMFFMLPGGSFEVAEACSGFRYIYSGLALSTLMAYLSFHSWFRRGVFVGASVVVFLVLNGVRATLVMAIASASEMRYLAHDHNWFGWVLFVLSLIGLYFAALRWSDAR